MRGIRRLILGLAAAGLLLRSAPVWAQATTCYGDCNGDGRVTINEIVRIVGIDLRGTLSLNDVIACPGIASCISVTLSQIVGDPLAFCVFQAAHSALAGCPPAATPVAWSSPVQASNAPS